MATSRAVSVTSTATDLVAQTMSGASYTRFLIYNNGSATIYLGDAGVTTTTGTPLAPGAYASLGSFVKIFGIAASGTHNVRVMEGV